MLVIYIAHSYEVIPVTKLEGHPVDATYGPSDCTWIVPGTMSPDR
jgi:hypothetical protein